MRNVNVIEALNNFVIRVAKGEATPEEVAVLPEVARIALAYDSPFGASPVVK